MKVKANWKENLHNLRAREMDLVLNYFSDCRFKSGLELGAGDGYQSKRLIERVDRLIATDLNESRLFEDQVEQKIKYQVLDAEMVGEHFDPASFDFVYSSNLLEHLPDSEKCLRGIGHILKDEGVAVHILPNSMWRFLATLLHFPNKLANAINRIGGDELGARVNVNNIKSASARKSKIQRFFIPQPHGVSSNVFVEQFAFSRSRWEKEFTRTGFEVLDVLKGPISSGYGFGFEGLKHALEKLGVTTEYIYIMKKARSKID